MKSRYGSLYKSVEFISKLIPNKNISLVNLEYINSVIDFLMDLDKLQQSNPCITLSIHASDGIWVNYNLERMYFIKPSQKYISLLLWKENKLYYSIKNESKLFKDVRNTSYDSKKYHIGKDELMWLIEFLKHMESAEEKKNSSGDSSNATHSRYIPGDVRQRVLSEFEGLGRICNGVHNKIKKHKVGKGEPIEFDHVLPHAKGGSNSENNIQILCETCNRLKSDSAL